VKYHHRYSEDLKIKTPVIVDGDKQYLLYPDDFETTRQYNMNNYTGAVSYFPLVKRYRASLPLNIFLLLVTRLLRSLTEGTGMLRGDTSPVEPENRCSDSRKQIPENCHPF